MLIYTQKSMKFFKMDEIGKEIGKLISHLMKTLNIQSEDSKYEQQSIITIITTYKCKKNLVN